MIIIAVTVTFRNPWFFGNFGVVDPGRVYRSAQPDGELRRLIARHHLASVLNLRGGTQDDPWYVEEVRATRDAGIELYDLPMSATRRPQRRELLILLNVFEQCSYPLLIHCKSGSDRTGLAAALYQMSQKGAPPEQALRAFSLHYGHVPLLGPEHLHEPLDEYAAWLKEHGQPHSPARLRFWVDRLYDPASAGRDVPKIQPGPRRRTSGLVSDRFQNLGKERGGLAALKGGRDSQVAENGRLQSVVELDVSPGTGLLEIE
jgi:protein tyrosine phosphatase (PTP) superfamily phosphohydrolase (DUF442 family)